MKRYEKVRRRAPGEKQISASRVGSGEVHGSSGNAATQNIFTITNQLWRYFEAIHTEMLKSKKWIEEEGEKSMFCLLTNLF